jgi:hypothetical protein
MGNYGVLHLSIPRSCMSLIFFWFYLFFQTLPSSAFIEPLPLIDTVAQMLGKDVYSKPITDADRVKVWNLFDYGNCNSLFLQIISSSKTQAD